MTNRASRLLGASIIDRLLAKSATQPLALSEVAKLHAEMQSELHFREDGTRNMATKNRRFTADATDAPRKKKRGVAKPNGKVKDGAPAHHGKPQEDWSLADWKAEAEYLRAKTPPGLVFTCKVSSNTGCICIYGLRRRPVALYATELLKILDKEKEIRAWIEKNRSDLSWSKDDSDARKSNARDSD